MSFLKTGLFAVLLLSTLSAGALASSHYIDERVYNVPRDAYAIILGIASNGTYVIRFDSGTLAGQTGSGWSDTDIASTYGCQGRFCAGEPSYNVPRDAFVTVIALQNNGSFAVQFTSGSLAGQTGHGWTDSDLAKLSGCSGSFCVGSRAYNQTRQAQVTIVGIQSTGQFVIRFNDGTLAGQTGHNWSASDLVYEGGGPVPQPFPQPLPQPQPHPGQINCVIRLGGTSTGQQTFNVMTPSGAIIGTFPTSAQAVSFAEADPRCRQ